MSLGPTTHLSARPYTADDEGAALALVNTDRLSGQPETTSIMLAQAVTGRSPVDSGKWAGLALPSTDVVHDAAGRVLGVVSYAVRLADDAGEILWMHCQEDQVVAEALVQHALQRLSPRTVHAFEYSSPLTCGLSGLPVRRRPATRTVLEAAGFSGWYRRRYLHGHLPIAGLPHAAQYTVNPSDDPPGKRLQIWEAGDVVAEAVIGLPMGKTGVLWRIDVAPHVHGRGLGAGLYGSAVDLLVGHGADEVIYYCDDREPGDPDRHLDRTGMTEVDKLFTYTRRP